MNTKNIIISTRAHKIGDVILSLPLATILKQINPELVIGFIGTEYTRAVIEACTSIDIFINESDFLEKEITLNGQKPECILHAVPVPKISKRSAKLKIPLRIGTNRRIYHWLTCNKLVNLTRKKSNLHEAQLNIKMLDCFGIHTDFSLKQIADLFAMPDLSHLLPEAKIKLDDKRFKVIIHAKSGGSAHEWSLQHYIDLIKSLDVDKFQVFISGTDKERLALEPLLEAVSDKVTDVCGLLNLPEFIGLIARCDALLACSTGPLHLAAILNKHALGIYAPSRPIFPQRWAPIGHKAQVFVLDEGCNLCTKVKTECFCIQAIQPASIKSALAHLYEQDYQAKSLPLK
ncbi:MAG: glycosyl transferase family 9 [Methylomonas sp.]|nr:MAG: glycosyl transferase family 9 [Methylomonas sp.]